MCISCSSIFSTSTVTSVRAILSLFALLFTVGKSIVPCVLLHALHDFCCYISADASMNFNIILGAVQFVILIAYFVYLLGDNRHA